MKEFKTKFGTMYIEKAHKSEPFKWVLLDSDKHWFSNIYNKKEFSFFKKYKKFEDLVENYFGWCCYSKTLENLLIQLNDISITENEEDKITMQELIKNEYLNHIGDYYIFFLE